MNIGFIGLGGMGKAIAVNLLKAGHSVCAWNRSPQPLAELAALGATAAPDPAAAFAADVVVSMLADDAAVRAVIIEPALWRHAKKNLVHVNMATVSVAVTRELAALHRAHGSAYVAAPVFGRPDAAAARKLHIVAAGGAAALAQLQPLFDAIGQKTWPVGTEPEQATAVKLGGNFMIAAAVEAMAEAAALSSGFGVPARAFLDVLTNTLFAAPVYQNYGALIADERYEPAAFRLALGLKDVNLALAASQEAVTPMPFASVLRDNLLDAIAHGDGDRDWAALAKVAFRRAGPR
jgi:3-hydroxyisobutyrate dehydrogenase-like beta-hydroxyacid dehydrogenase